MMLKGVDIGVEDPPPPPPPQDVMIKIMDKKYNFFMNKNYIKDKKKEG